MIKTIGELIAEIQGHINCVDAEAAKALYDQAEGALLIDVREANEKDQLTAAINIPRGLLELKIDSLSPQVDTLILTHCGGGTRASLAAAALQNMGYTNVHAITASFAELKALFR